MLTLVLILMISVQTCFSWNAYIHIGPHKTGSTNLQNWLIKLKGKFYKNFGITVLLRSCKDGAYAFSKCFRGAYPVMR